MAGLDRDEIAKLEALHSANPEGRIFTHLAEAYRKAGELARARELVERGLERHPEYSSAHVVLGRILLDQGEWAAAEGAFHRVLRLDPENRVALRSLAEIAAQSGRLADAASYYRELLLLDPADEAAAEALRAVLDAGADTAVPPAGEFPEPDSADPEPLLDWTPPLADAHPEPLDLDLSPVDNSPALPIEPLDLELGYLEAEEESAPSPLPGFEPLDLDGFGWGEPEPIDLTDAELDDDPLAEFRVDPLADMTLDPVADITLDPVLYAADDALSAVGDEEPFELSEVDPSSLVEGVAAEPVEELEAGFEDDPLAEWRLDDDPADEAVPPAGEVASEPVDLVAAEEDEGEVADWAGESFDDLAWEPPAEPMAELVPEPETGESEDLVWTTLTDAVEEPEADPADDLEPATAPVEEAIWDTVADPVWEPAAEPLSTTAGVPVPPAGEVYDVDQSVVDPFGDDDFGTISLVTETMGDLYASQGLVTQAIQVYKELLVSRPGDPGLLGKIEQMERVLAGGGARIAGEQAPAPQEAAAFESSEEPLSLDEWMVEEDEPDLVQTLADAVPAAGAAGGGRTIGAYLSALIAYGQAAAPVTAPAATALVEPAEVAAAEVVAEMASSEVDDVFERDAEAAAGFAGAAEGLPLLGETGAEVDPEPFLLDASMVVEEEAETESPVVLGEEAVLVLDEAMVVDEEGSGAEDAGSATPLEDDDLEVFRAWLRNLKR